MGNILEILEIFEWDMSKEKLCNRNKVSLNFPLNIAKYLFYRIALIISLN